MAQDGSGPTSRSDTGRKGAKAAFRRPLVAFDFDGTLTVRDSFKAYLRWRSGPVRYGVGLARLAPAALAYLVHKDRGRIKAQAVGEFLKGVDRERLVEETRAFAEEIAPRFLRPDALAAWRRWRAEGAELVIVTASPREVVAPFAERLGADRLIATELLFDAQDRVAGPFATPNCRGPEKVARLESVYGRGVTLKAAYGDTSGDREMLAIAEERGYRVFTQPP